MAGTFKSRRKFLTDLTLEPPSKSKRLGIATSADESDDFVTLSTIHASKGLEWRSVYVLNVTEGALPSSRCRSDADIEEQRRLLYVAMTRAKRELTFTVPTRTSGPGSWSRDKNEAIGRRSRFLPDELLGSSRSTGATTTPPTKPFAQLMVRYRPVSPTACVSVGSTREVGLNGAGLAARVITRAADKALIGKKVDVRQRRAMSVSARQLIKGPRCSQLAGAPSSSQALVQLRECCKG